LQQKSYEEKPLKKPEKFGLAAFRGRLAAKRLRPRPFSLCRLLQKPLCGTQRKPFHLSNDPIQLATFGYPGRNKLRLRGTEKTALGFAADFTRPVIVGTVQARWGTMAGAGGLATDHEAFYQSAAMDVSDVQEGGFELLVVLLELRV